MKVSVVTSIGQNYFRDALANSSVIQLSRVDFGDGTVNDQPSAIALTALINRKKSIAIESISKHDNLALVKVILNNIGETVGYSAREVGIYAKLLDNTEVLVMYINYDTEASFIQPESNGLVRLDMEFKLVLVNNTMSIVNSPSGDLFVSKEYLDSELAKKIGAHTTEITVGIININSSIKFGNNKPLTISYDDSVGRLKFNFR